MAREVLSNGVIVPEKYTRDWFDDFRTNLVKLNDAITAIAGKQNALTQEQLDAVNSAITSQKVTAYDDHIADTSKHLTDGTAPKAIADEDGTSIKTGYVNVAGNQTVTGDKSFTGSNTFNNILPNATNTYSLGSSSYQWSAVYAQSYYYNGTAWGLDKSNTWTGENTFSSMLKQVNSTVTKGTIPQSDTTAFSVYWGGTGVSSLNNALFAQRGYVNADGSTTYILYALENATGGTQTQIGLKYDPNDTVNKRYAYLRGDFRPYADNSFNLGTSTNKWKTLNGINPGALSLPDVSASVVVDTTDWVYDGLTANLIKFNNAVQTFSGWLYITAQNTSASDRIVVRYIGSDASNLTFMSGKFDSATSIFVACPIVAGVSTYVWSTKALNTIKIYKAQGNV